MGSQVHSPRCLFDFINSPTSSKRTPFLDCVWLAAQGSMATDIQAALAPILFQPEACGPKQCIKGDPKHPKGDPVPLPEPLENSTHAVLQVQKPVSPGPKSFSVNVFNSSDGMKLLVNLKSTDTIGKLQQEVLKLSPDLGASPNLVYNGKPVQPHQMLSELQVKPGATFFTYLKCHGG